MPSEILILGGWMIQSVLVLILSTFCWGSMSDVDLEVREMISAHLDVSFDDIHSMHFAGHQEGCYFVIAAQAENKTCHVCFIGQAQDYRAQSVRCD